MSRGRKVARTKCRDDEMSRGRNIARTKYREDETSRGRNVARKKGREDERTRGQKGAKIKGYMDTIAFGRICPCTLYPITFVYYILYIIFYKPIDFSNH